MITSAKHDGFPFGSISKASPRERFEDAAAEAEAAAARGAPNAAELWKRSQELFFEWQESET